MSEIIDKVKVKEADLITDVKLSLDDVVQHKNACATSQLTTKHEHPPGPNTNEVPAKKRKTRRGKSKRRHPYSYIKNGVNGKSNIKPEAPYNSNQFLLEDHGDMQELDKDLQCVDQISTSTFGRTRDSSFSVDSDGEEFYSSPDDEEQFLIKDFDDQYESAQAERLQTMSKDELIKEYLMLENKVEVLTKRLRKKPGGGGEVSERSDFQLQIEKLEYENENLKRENEWLRSKVNEPNSVSCSSGSEDSETDSSESCSSSTSSTDSDCSNSRNSSKSRSRSPVILDTPNYAQTNGHSSAGISPV